MMTFARMLSAPMRRAAASYIAAAGVLVFAGAVQAAPKLDKETCDQLKAEQTKFVETGIVADIEKGAAWGKANLSTERLREVEHFILLDEQLKFGCRQVTLTIDAMRAGEAARRLELNPNADPTAPVEPPAAAGAQGTSEGVQATLPGQTVPGHDTAAEPAANRTRTIQIIPDDPPPPVTRQAPKPRTDNREGGPKPAAAAKPPGEARAKPSDAYVPPAQGKSTLQFSTEVDKAAP